MKHLVGCYVSWIVPLANRMDVPYRAYLCVGLVQIYFSKGTDATQIVFPSWHRFLLGKLFESHRNSRLTRRACLGWRWLYRLSWLCDSLRCSPRLSSYQSTMATCKCNILSMVAEISIYGAFGYNRRRAEVVGIFGGRAARDVEFCWEDCKFKWSQSKFEDCTIWGASVLCLNKSFFILITGASNRKYRTILMARRWRTFRGTKRHLAWLSLLL